MHKLLQCLKNRVDEHYEREEEKKKMTGKRALIGETENTSRNRRIWNVQKQSVIAVFPSFHPQTSSADP